MAFQRILSRKIILPVAGIVRVHVNAVQDFPTGPGAWGWRVEIDGALVFNTGRRAAIQDIVHFSVRRECAAGERWIHVDWAGDNNVSLSAASADIEGLPNTTTT